ncbi:MAG: beta-phosphoglucomutase [Anaerolineae bacterium]|nr:beta-phosphoglucomutase [Anaerolineae bacterium]
MSEIKAFIFDLDGVITDTAEFHYRAWKRLADEEGIPFTREDNEALRGVSRRESLARLLKGRPITEEQAQAWMARKNGYYQQYLTEITPGNLLPGATDFLADARTRGVKIAVGSASRNARTVLDSLQITDQLDAIGDGYSVTRSKPAPDLFIWVAGRLDLPPGRCAVFEDAEAGIDAALAAGAYAVGVGPAERVGHAHLRLPNGLADITVPECLERLGNL